MAGNSSDDSLRLLPIELWLFILELATLLPDSDFSGFLDFREEPDTTKTGSSIKYCLATRRQVVLVCKLWNILATPFLYEYLLIGNRIVNPVVNQLLLRTLVESKMGVCRPPLGSWTKRLYISLTSCSALKDITPILHILRLLPNLFMVRFFTFLSGSEFPEAILDTIVETSGQSLRTLYTSGIFLSKPISKPLLGAAPNLCTIGLGFSCKPGIDAIRLLPVSPSLKKMILSNTLRGYVPAPNQFPSLQELVYYYDSSDIMHWTPFLQACGGTLTRIAIYINNTPLSVSFMETITSYCPNLTLLDLQFRRWSLLQPPFVVPQIRHLHISICAVECPEDYSQFLESFTAVFMGSHIDAVQLLASHNVMDLRRHKDTFDELCAHCRHHRITLLDHRGEQLTT